MTEKHDPTERQIYLSLQDAKDLTSGSDLSGAGAAPNRQLAHQQYPGWVSPTGHVSFDDGPLEYETRERSWQRTGECRLSGLCVLLARSMPSSVIIHAPHTSTHVPAAVRAELLLTDSELDEELQLMTDSGVLDVITEGGPVAAACEPGRRRQPVAVGAAMSRLVFDPERFPNDDMEAVGMGVVYMRRASGAPFRRPLTSRRRAWYHKQHAAYTRSVERVVKSALQQFGQATIIDLHSYPTRALPCENQDSRRPEICLGTDPFHTPPRLLAATRELFEASFDGGVNTPFAGSHVPGGLYQTDSRVSSIMVEVRRDVLSTPDRVTQIARRLLQLAALQEAPGPDVPRAKAGDKRGTDGYSC